MTTPAFLIQDSSWRTFPIPWNEGFNTALTRASQSAPPFSTPFTTEKAEQYRDANNNALRLLDSRQIDKQGHLPNHVCGMAFWGWSEAEERLIKEQTYHSTHAARDESFDFVYNLLFAWRCVFKFNLANLTLIDANAPSMMRTMTQGQFAEISDWLDQAINFEPALEAQLVGLPSPTRQVRYAVQQALDTFPQR
ncbi:hypothetical protein [Leucobacter sp. NPDC077196]|uniref:hypothetical protein n=1 Tax=Leucobacter sp. NPDC077196 TaxID=3154959 RepID=UPI0034429B2B